MRPAWGTWDWRAAGSSALVRASAVLTANLHAGVISALRVLAGELLAALFTPAVSSE